MLLDVLVWVAIGGVMLTGLFVGSHVRAERKPKDYAATAAAVRRKMRWQVRVTGEALAGADGRPVARMLVELMLIDVNPCRGYPALSGSVRIA